VHDRDLTPRRRAGLRLPAAVKRSVTSNEQCGVTLSNQYAFCALAPCYRSNLHPAGPYGFGGAFYLPRA
jgi:hypothetical protein